jgi:hypothetical protein
MEDAASRVCRFLYDELTTPEGQRACALIRLYKTHPFEKLGLSERAFARVQLNGAEPDGAMRCLTLLATVGDETRWSDRRRSKGHRVIPLPSPEIVEKAPMISALIKQFGVDLSAIVRPTPGLMRDFEGKSYGVFHVETAAGSPYIPAQEDFVLRYGIRSVVGCGGSLRDGEMFALILFTRVRVTPSAAERFRTIALDLKSVLFPFGDEQVFSAD